MTDLSKRKPTPFHNPINISSRMSLKETKENIARMIRRMETVPASNFVYIMPEEIDFRTTFLPEFQQAVGDKPYEVQMNNKIIRFLNRSTVKFLSVNRDIEQAVAGMRLTGFFVDSSIPVEPHMLKSLAGRVHNY